MAFIFAQALGEYGTLDSIAASVRRTAYSIGSLMAGLPPTVWIVAAVVVLGLWFWSRR